MRSIERAIEELERAYQTFLPLFGKEMPQPVIVIQTKNRKNALGWFAGDKWQNSTSTLAEITIAAEHLKRSPEDIAEVLLHEMCHYANYLDGISDCTSFQYHNKRFKERAESIGLIVEKNRRGWSETSLGDALLERVREVNLDASAFSLFRLGKENKKQPTKLKKWRCGCTNIRAATTVTAICQACGNPFVTV
jgi:predicted SprT family Zn-dependent metalloprotease